MQKIFEKKLQNYKESINMRYRVIFIDNCGVITVLWPGSGSRAWNEHVKFELNLKHVTC